MHRRPISVQGGKIGCNLLLVFIGEFREAGTLVATNIHYLCLEINHLIDTLCVYVEGIAVMLLVENLVSLHAEALNPLQPLREAFQPPGGIQLRLTPARFPLDVIPTTCSLLIFPAGAPLYPLLLVTPSLRVASFALAAPRAQARGLVPLILLARLDIVVLTTQVFGMGLLLLDSVEGIVDRLLDFVAQVGILEEAGGASTPLLAQLP